MDWEKYDKFIRKESQELVNLIHESTGGLKLNPLLLLGFLQQFLVGFLAERREKAPKILEIIPDFSADEFAALLEGDIKVGDRITIQAPQYLIESIVEQIRVVSQTKLKYKH